MAPRPESDAGSETASEPESAPAPSSPPQPKSTPPKKGRLGQIGGRAKSPALDAPDAPGQHPPRRRIGAIGKRPAAAPVSPKPAEDVDDRPNEKTALDEEKHSEGPADQADRRRQELRKELDRKAAAGPAKKKRKF